MSKLSPNQNKRGQFVKGNRANPGGRPKGIAKKIKEMSNNYEDYLEMLDAWARNPKNSIKIRLECIRELLNRGAGKPVQNQTLEVTVPEPIQYVLYTNDDETDTSN